MRTSATDTPSPNLTLEVPAAEFPWRLLRLLNGFRMLAAGFLIALFLYPESPRPIGGSQPELFAGAVLLWLLFGALNDFAVKRKWPSFNGQAIAQIIVDTAAVSALTHASGGLATGIGNLLVVSVGALSLVSPRHRALTFAAVAALGILAEQYLAVLRGVASVSETTSAGVLGGILMFVAFAVEPLARRLQESEDLARRRGVDLENLNQLNEYIIQNLRESIVVVGGDDRIRLVNEAAAQYLGLRGPGTGTPLGDVSPDLLRYARAWRDRAGKGNPAPRPITAADGSTLINPYFAAIGRPRSGALLIFLEDVSLIAEKVQQSKLAALGRLSASIAHEIRNPVGAMSHAAQLLSEAPGLAEPDKRLTGIIEANARRVSAIVDNVLQLSRGEHTSPEHLELVSWTRQFLEEFTSTQEIRDGLIELGAGMPELEVRMDPSHLHQVLWNLCENAVRYGGGGKIHIMVARWPGTGRPFLEVRDRGPGIPSEAADRIFEPFFRGNPKGPAGSGLGLFISRGLCECNRAALVYQPRTGGGSVFRIIFADPRRWNP